MPPSSTRRTWGFELEFRELGRGLVVGDVAQRLAFTMLVLYDDEHRRAIGLLVAKVVQEEGQGYAAEIHFDRSSSCCHPSSDREERLRADELPL